MLRGSIGLGFCFWSLAAASARSLVLASIATLAAAAAGAAPLAPGDLLISCAYWGVTRIEPATGEQHPLGVGRGASYDTIAVDGEGIVWTIDNRWVVSIDRATGEHRLILQLPNDFDATNNGELLPEPAGTLLYAGDGGIWRIDPDAREIDPVLSGAPLVKPLGIDRAANGDLLIADSGAGAVFRWNQVDGISTVASGDLLVGPSRVRQLADGDLLVLRGGRPVRVDPADGAQSLYSDAIGAVNAARIAANGDLIHAAPTTGGGAVLARSTSPEATPIPLLDAGLDEKVGSIGGLALDAAGRVVFLGIDRELTNGVVTDSNGAIFQHDPVLDSTRVLSRRPPAGGIATGADGRLFLASQSGTGFNLREIDPRTGETRRAAAGALFTRPLDAAVEADGRVVVLNGIPNGIPSVLRAEPDTGNTVELSPTDQLVDPEKIAVAPNGDVFVSDFQVGIVRVDPTTGAQSIVPDSDDLTFNDDLEVEASGALIVAEQAGERLWRVDPATGQRAEVGPLLDRTQELMDPRGYGGVSALALGQDGVPIVSLVASSAPNGYALFRAPTDATDATLVSDLGLCAGDDLEVVRAVPEPEPGAAASAALAFAALAARMRRRSRARD